MFEKQQKLNISQQELGVIEAALHTQVQILSVQANAGGADARSKLNEVKRVLATLEQQKPCKSRRSVGFGFQFLKRTRLFG